jgi:hypothetical protein
MSERLTSLSDQRLGEALASLDLDWPETPAIASAVMATVAGGRPAAAVPLPRRRRTKILLIAAAVTLLLAGAAVAARLVFDLGAVVVRVPEEGGTLPTASPPPFGEPVSVEEAEDLLGSEVPVPAAPGAPDRVWADRVTTEAGEVVRVTLAWRPRPGLPAIEGSRFGAVLMRFEGDLEVASKEVYADTGSLEGAWVGNTEAVWTTGPHRLELLTAGGPTSVRVDGNVLLWRDGDQTLRLETDLPKQRSEAIAESIPGTS